MGFGETGAADERHSVSTHETRYIGADDVLSQKLFKSTQNSIIVKRSALYNNMFSQIGGSTETDYFVQCIFNDRIAKARGDIGDINSVFLGFPDTGIHENRTTGTEVCRMLCHKCHL